jgi:carboxylesterase type B
MGSGTLTVDSDNKRRETSNFRDLTDGTHWTFINSNSKETLDCLRSLPLETLLEAEITVRMTDSLTESGLEVFIPLVNGDFLPEAPSKLFAQGRFAKAPMIAGWAEDDGTIFTPQNTTTEEEAISFVESGPFLPDTDIYIKALFSSYQPINSFQPAGTASLSPAFYQMARIEQEILFLCNALFMASKVTPPEQKTHSRP